MARKEGIFGLLVFLTMSKVVVQCAVVIGGCKKSIAVIGAGPSGLTSAKNAISEGFDVTIYEQGEELGGLWVYTDDIGTGKYGLNVHSAMYKGLRTNTPKQLIEFPDFHHPNKTATFPSHSDILKYLHGYADQFDLHDHIKLNHLVIRVLPVANGKWEVIVKNLPNSQFITKIYDAVFVCNGHYFAPRIPEIEGASEFQGKVIHSHDYRNGEFFRGENVLVIGAEASGIDLAIQLSRVANRVTLSQNKYSQILKIQQNSFPVDITIKNNVKRFTANGAEFIDGTHQSFSLIIYATGYNYSYPFLSVDSGIHVEDNFVQSLYKHIFNIQHPTMVFIGVTRNSIYFPVFDLQARFALKFLSGQKQLPSKQEMLKDLEDETQAHWKKGYSKAKTHYLINEQRDYFNQLSELADIKNIPSIYDVIMNYLLKKLKEDPTEFRKYLNTSDIWTWGKFEFMNEHPRTSFSADHITQF